MSDLKSLPHLRSGGSPESTPIGLQHFDRSLSHTETQNLTARLDLLRRPKPIFSDSEALKEKVRKSLPEPAQNVEDYYWTQGVAQRVARHVVFEHVTLAVIMVNALWIGFESDNNSNHLLVDADLMFQIVENFFCCYFVLEWLVRFLAFRRKRDGFKDGWFIFDTFLVALMVAETWIITAAVAFSGDSSGYMNDTSILRLARLLRLSRMARMARLLRSVPELLIMVKGMLAATRSVLLTIGLLVAVLYACGIALKQVTSGTEAGSTDFATVSMSMYTLVLHATLLDSPSRVLESIGFDNVMGIVLFFFAIFSSALLLLNMLVGILCEVACNVSAREKEQLSVNLVKEKVWQVLAETGLDENGDGLISQAELLRIFDNENATRRLQEAGVDIVGLVDFADVIFQSDAHGHEYGKLLDFNDFMSLVLQLRGTNSVTVKDVVDLRKFVHAKTTQVSNQVARVEDRLRHMELKLVTQWEPLGATRRTKASSREAGDLRSCASCVEKFTCASEKAGVKVFPVSEDATSQRHPHVPSSQEGSKSSPATCSIQDHSANEGSQGHARLTHCDRPPAMGLSRNELNSATPLPPASLRIAGFPPLPAQP
eukprot:TRINITY_DN22446_c0_g1_i1.p1 TRINITY_DN22446_c0_g1~~TRINITY_DN22446_c0_g1_i1.p1  ORF type:complete len:599 (+),score=73.29 TRINITY_DN22446_c0_g1_i1:88-1884(+)